MPTPLPDALERPLDLTIRGRDHLAAHPELRRPAGRGRITRTGSPGVALAPNEGASFSAIKPTT